MSNDTNIDATIERIAAEATDRWYAADEDTIPELVRRAVRAGYEAGRRDAASTVMELATAAWRAAEEAAEVGGEEGVALAAEARAMALGDAAKALGALVASKEADRG